MIEQPPFAPEAPPRAEDVFGDGRYIMDRMHSLLAHAAAGHTKLFWFCYQWGKIGWLQWLEQEGFLAKVGDYGYYPEDGPVHYITSKGHLWLMQEGHKPK